MRNEYKADLHVNGGEGEQGQAGSPLHSQHHNAPAGKSNFISVPQQNTLVICNQALKFPSGVLQE